MVPHAKVLAISIPKLYFKNIPHFAVIFFVKISASTLEDKSNTFFSRLKEERKKKKEKTFLEIESKFLSPKIALIH